MQEAPVGTSAARADRNFPTQEAKDQEAIQAFSRVASTYPGTTEGEIAQYYLGSIQADQGKLADAEKRYQEVAQKGDEKYASLAKLSLAQIYFADGREDAGRERAARPDGAPHRVRLQRSGADNSWPAT